MVDKRMRLEEGDVHAAVLGGAVLGGGGGGTIEEGLRLGLEALVGAPGDPRAQVLPRDYLRAWELLMTLVDEPIGGVISCENGGTASVHGWIQSAVFNVPVVDAPANGRAHPTAAMGSMGLERVQDWRAVQAAAGGRPETGAYLEQRVAGSLSGTNMLIRLAAREAGGLVAVARNPVKASYLAEYAAPGALTQALELGRLLNDARAPRRLDAVIPVLEERLAARVIAIDEVRDYTLRSEGGYDVGSARIGTIELTIWNEYITLERAGERLATFPDLIVTLDRHTGMPLTSAELHPGRSIAILSAPAERLILGAGVRCPEHFLALEAAVDRQILPFVSEELLARPSRSAG
jgi:DUF917 family protein